MTSDRLLDSLNKEQMETVDAIARAVALSLVRGEPSVVIFPGNDEKVGVYYVKSDTMTSDEALDASMSALMELRATTPSTDTEN